MDRYLAIFQRSQFPFVVVDKDDVMSEVRKTRPCYQAYISGAYDSDPHVQTPVME